MVDSGAGGAALILVILFIACYLIPTIIAFLRHHKDAPAIAAINILLGWSVVGWFVSFIWALADPRGRSATQTVVVNTAVATGTAPAQASTQPPPMRDAERTDADTAFWDSIDKRDPDALEEYLVRFPAGKFVQLARSRLERAGVQAPAAPEQSGA